MTLYGDPLFVAAELEYRYGTRDTGHWPVRPSRSPRHGLRAVMERLHHRHVRPATPRVA